MSGTRVQQREGHEGHGGVEGPQVQLHLQISNMDRIIPYSRHRTKELQTSRQKIE